MPATQVSLADPKAERVKGIYPFTYIFTIIGIHYMVTLTAVFVGLFFFRQAGPNFTTHLGHTAANYFNQFDVDWYNQIAKLGYFSSISTAFFPLWPLILRVLNENTWLELAVSNVLFMMNAFLLYRVTQSVLSERFARNTVWLFVFSPMSLYFNIGYSENIFMLTTLLSVLSYTSRTYRGILWPFLSALTRPPGILVGLLGIRSVAVGIKSKNWGHIGYGLLFGASSLCGLLTFMVYLKFHGDPPFAFVYAERSWRHPAMPFTPIWHSISMFVTSKTDVFPFVFDLVITLSTIGLWIAYLNKLPWELSLYTFSYLILALSSEVRWYPLASAGRIMMGLFTGYVMFAPLLRSRVLHLSYATLGLLSTMFGLVAFMHGYWLE